MRHAATVTVLTLMAAMTLAVTPPTAPTAAAPLLPAGFQLLDYPTGQGPYNLTNFAWLGDGGLLTSGKDGTITFVPPGGEPRLLGQVPEVRAGGDHGLLGLAPANDYDATGHVFVSYDKGDPAATGFGMVEQWTASPAADPTSFTFTRTVIDGSTTSPQLRQETQNHGIDAVVVAPDDSLFVSIGDDSLNNGDPRTLRAQDTTTPYGKLLHLTPEGRGHPGNPFYSSSAPRSWRSMVYAYGFRNPFRFNLDPRSGIVHLGDVGWRTTEEVDTVTAGENAGWPCYEGVPKTTFSSYATCQALYADGTAQPPITSYQHDGTGASVVGGVHYTGTSYPAQYHDSYFYGDYSRNMLWTLATDSAGRLTRAPEPGGFATGVGGPVAFHTGPNGDVTFADLLNGTVRRLAYTAGNRAPVARFSSSVDAASRTVTLSAADSYDLDGDQLTYAWDLGDGTSATGQSVTHTYATGADATVVLTVQDEQGASGTSTAVVYPTNYTPTLTLDAPASRTYAVGDTVSLSASATDVEDGALAVSWDTALLHCPFADSCHRHPDGTVGGPTYSRAFTDHGSDTTMLVVAHAVDSRGATATATYEAVPTLRNLTVNSPVAATINGVTAFAAQVVAGSAVRVSAPVSSSYWQLNSWSDGGAAAHGFTMPDADLTLTATYRTAIDVRYGALGGRRSFLKTPTSPEYDVPGGRARNFLGGRLYWAPSAGARFSSGALLTRYLARGGPDGYGLPTTDNRVVRGGRYAHFTGSRSIFKGSKRRARLVYGVIRKRYAALGYQRSCLGFPTTKIYSIPGGRRQRFVHGTITHTSSDGRTSSHC